MFASVMAAFVGLNTVAFTVPPLVHTFVTIPLGWPPYRPIYVIGVPYGAMPVLMSTDEYAATLVPCPAAEFICITRNAPLTTSSIALCTFVAVSPLVLLL